MTDRIWTNPDIFEISDKVHGDLTIETGTVEDNIRIEVDNGIDECGFIYISRAEFQALVDWARTNGIVK